MASEIIDKDNISEVYNVEPYSWDGSSRPNIDNYIEPWSRYASAYYWEEPIGKKKKANNAAIEYAKSRLDAAITQYNADLSYWNEQDERNYTTPAAQSLRYEEADYNLGYMYSQVDSGNSAVGYDQQTDDSYIPDNRGNSLNSVKKIVDCVTSCLSLATSFVQSGVSLAKLPHELSNIDAQTDSLNASTRLSNIKADFDSFLQSHDVDGNPVESLANSLAFSFQSIQFDKFRNESNFAHSRWVDQVNWNLYAKKVYSLQSTPTASEGFNQWIYSLDLPDWAKALSVVLGAAVGATWSGSVRLKNPSSNN